MALKIAGKLEELRKTEEKIKRLQDKKKLIEQSIKRDEDEEIVKALRSLNLSHEDLVETLGDLRSGRLSACDLKDRACGGSGDNGKEDDKSAETGITGSGVAIEAAGKGGRYGV